MRWASSVVERAVGDAPAAGDDHDAVAGRGDLLEHVAGEQHRAAVGGVVAERVRSARRACGSSPVAGSSSSRTSGSASSAAASARRRRVPNEHAPIRRPAIASRPARSSASSGSPRLARAAASVSSSRAVRPGWKPSRSSTPFTRPVVSRRPAVALARPNRMRNVVVFQRRWAEEAAHAALRDRERRARRRRPCVRSAWSGPRRRADPPVRGCRSAIYMRCSVVSPSVPCPLSA